MSRKLKIGFVVVGPPNVASSRLQGYQIVSWLNQSNRHRARIVNLPTRYQSTLDRRGFFAFLYANLSMLDAVIFQKVSGPYVHKAMRICQALGVKTIFVDCDLRTDYPFSKLVDCFVSPSKPLAEYIEEKTGCRPVVIPDPIEYWRHPDQAMGRPIANPVRAVWVGSRNNFHQIEELKRELNDAEVSALEIKTISDHLNADIPWSLEHIESTLLNFDAGILPVTDDSSSRLKSLNRATLFMALSMPLIVKESGVYNELVSNGRNAFVYRDSKELGEICTDLQIREKKDRIVRQAYDDVQDFDIQIIGNKWGDTIEQVCSGTIN